MSSEVVKASLLATGERLKKVRWISRRTQPSTAHSSGGSTGAAGPGAKNGDNTAATKVVATPTTILGIAITD
jgi:hypothetical protein